MTGISLSRNLHFHTIQTRGMQNQNEKDNRLRPIDLNALKIQPMKDEKCVKMENVNIADIFSRSIADISKTKEEKEVKMEDSTEKPASIASVHVVDELRKTLRKKLSESGTSSYSHDAMEITSSFAEQDRMDPDESDVEKRKQKRRERNRLAAQRCRLKKREHAICVLQEANKLENANEELRYKVRQLQQERETLHSLIRKHLSNCTSHPEIETSNTANTEVAQTERQHQQMMKATEAPSEATTATWTVNSATEKMNVVDSMDRNKTGLRSESIQIAQVKHEPITGTGVRHDAVKVRADVTEDFIWPGMVHVQAQPGTTSIPPHTVTGTTAAIKTLLGPEMPQVQVSAVAHINYSTPQPLVGQYFTNMSIPDLDRPLVTDLNTDRCNKNTPDDTESITSKSMQQSMTNIIGHYVVP